MESEVAVHSTFSLLGSPPGQGAVCLSVIGNVHATAVVKSTQQGSSLLYLVEHADRHVQRIMSVV